MDYFEQRNEHNILRIRQLIKELPDFCNEFFIGIQTRTSPLTRLNYAYDLRIFFDYLSKEIYNNNVAPKEITLADINNLKAFDIERYIEYLDSYEFNGKKYKCGEKAKERKLASLRSFFKYYFKKDKLESDITRKVDMPKIHDKAIIRLEADEVAKLLDMVDSDDITSLSKRQNAYHSRTKVRDTAILTLFLGTGIRISELVGLNKNDFDFNNNSFIVTRKGGNKSILYFGDEVAQAIQNYLAWIENEKKEETDFAANITDNDCLFYSLQGKRISVRAVENLVKKYSKIITPLKKITPHKLRSTFGTELYRNTKDIYVVADVLGHRDVNTTKKHYAAISDEIRRKAAETVKLRNDDDDK